MANSINYWSISSIVLTHEAKKLGFEVDIISKNKNTYSIKGNGKNIMFKSTDFGGNSSLGLKLVNDKELAYQILKKNNLPTAKSYYLTKKKFNIFELSNILNLKYPLVIKPINESHGNGVKMNILNFSELNEKLCSSFDKYENMIIQEEIKGDEIRILVVKGKILLAINRIPAIIFGDGNNSIKQLIDIENNSNQYRGKGYKKPLAIIEINEELISYISKQNFNFNNIPNKGVRVQLRGNSNIGTGGTMTDITETISSDIKKMYIKACEIFGLEICGVDILTTDFTKTLKETGGVILELNANPGIGGDKELTNVNTGKEILKSLFF